MANHLITFSSIRANHGITLKQIYSKIKLYVDYLWVFNSISYLHISKKIHSKLKSKIARCIFLGYDDQTKFDRIFDPLYYKIFIICDFIFDKILFGFDHVKNHLKYNRNYNT